MAINKKKCVIKLSFETPLPESLQDIPRMNETTCKYLALK